MKGLLLSVLLSGIFFTAFSQKNGILFHRMNEPKENAFSLLVPKGWIVEGGALRLLDANIAGANNMVECKFDLSVKKDTAGSVMIRWLPDMLCIDQRNAWGNREGAVFNNCLVRCKRDPVSFMLQVAVPYAHPAATNVNVKVTKPLPGMVARYNALVDPAVKTVTNMSYQAVLIEFTYQENGKSYMERMITVIEDYGMNGGGLWKNRETMLIRAPENELAGWEPVLEVIQNSGIWSMSWIAGEANGQRQRSGLINLTQQELQQMDKEINDDKQRTNSEINKDMYLTLTGQNEYKNPFSGKIETDTDNWKNRWVNSSGDIIYSGDASYDPNHDPDLNVSGFRRSVPRQ
jgi:hypothetical protein